MNLQVIMLLLFAIATEICREVSFKLAANKSAEVKTGGSYLMRLFGTPRIWFGFFCWGFQIILWIKILSQLSLSIAFPIMSLCYVFTIIASKYVLHESITTKKWIGVAAITLGVAIIGSQGIG